jgi:sn-glycerol 3-phosphate transport system permease protein
MRRGRGGSAAVVAAGAVAAAAWLVPYAWMVLTSFKTLEELVAHPARPYPEHLALGAYREVFAAMPVGRYLAVTVAMALSIAAAQIALALPAGYALAKLRFVGRRHAFGVVVACLLVPAQATFVPVFLVLAKVRLIDTMAALVLPFAASALGTFLVRQALLGVPDEIIEAARMDGASEWTIVYRILAPMIRPTLVSLFLVSFVFHYSDYFWPLVMTTDDSVRTLPLGVALLREQGTGVRWNIVMAGNVVLSAPVLVLFAVTQRHLLRGVRRAIWLGRRSQALGRLFSALSLRLSPQERSPRDGRSAARVRT